MNERWTLRRWLSAASLALFLAGVPFAQALPVRFVPVDTGHFAGTDWRLGVAANGRERCYRLTMDGRGGFSEAKLCDQEIPQFHLWDRVFGSSDGAATAQVSVSTIDVAKVNLLLVHPGSKQGPNWRSLRMRLLRKGEARRAHLKRDFRFAVLTGVGNLCVKKVRVFDPAGTLLEKRSDPCEY